MRVVTSIVVALALGSTVVAAQATKATPGPEHKRMANFAGQWNYQGEAKASPLGPAGRSRERRPVSGSRAAFSSSAVPRAPVRRDQALATP